MLIIFHAKNTETGMQYISDRRAVAEEFANTPAVRRPATERELYFCKLSSLANGFDK